MTGIVLTGCTNTPIIREVAVVLGIIMQGLYNLFSAIGIHNIGLCIITFTVVVKLLMIPMSIKQQRFQKLSALINPEIQAIQKKYKNKKDQASIMKMQEETKAIYSKYGTSPTGGCLQLLIQMPILFALYAVISNVPLYVDQVNTMYTNISTQIIKNVKVVDDVNTLNMYIDGYYENKDNDDYSYKYSYVTNMVKDINIKENDKVEDLNTLLSTNTNKDIEKIWTNIEKTFNNSDELVENIKNLTDNEFNAIIEKMSEKNREQFVKYAEYTDSEWDKIAEEFTTADKVIEKERDEINTVYSFVGIDLGRSPSIALSLGIWWALLIPILSAAFQFLSTRLMSATQSMADNPMASSMKTMNIMMPLVSGFFAFSLPAGMGLYWVISSMFQVGQQVLVNKYFEKTDINDIVKQSIEKANKKREKKGLPPNKITDVANTRTSNVKVDNKNTVKPSNTTNNNESNSSNSNSNVKSGSIASKANLVKEFNEKNNKK